MAMRLDIAQNILGICFLVALLAIAWPTEWTIDVVIPSFGKKILGSVGCPLVRGDLGRPGNAPLWHSCPCRLSLHTACRCMQGYEGELPGDHPPVEVVPGVKYRTLAIYHNGSIWTADREVRSIQREALTCTLITDDSSAPNMSHQPLMANRQRSLKVGASHCPGLT
jgi:hypothetical protein